MPAARSGDFTALPWHVLFTVPTATVFATWRQAAGPEPLAPLQETVLAAPAAGHDTGTMTIVRSPYVTCGWGRSTGG